MKVETFFEMWKAAPPGQQVLEYYHLLKFVHVYWALNKVKDPVVVEIGIRRGRQKAFWNELGATHLGIDISNRYGVPEILGDSHDRITWRKVDVKLRAMKTDGKCDLLFIDGDHSFGGVMKDYFTYRDLCSGIIVFHDIHCLRKDVEVNRFWNDLRSTARRKGSPETFIEFFHPQPPDNYGIGIIVRES